MLDPLSLVSSEVHCVFSNREATKSNSSNLIVNLIVLGSPDQQLERGFLILGSKVLLTSLWLFWRVLSA